MNEGPCLYCDVVTSEGRVKDVELGVWIFSHKKCHNLMLLRLEDQAVKKAEADPDNESLRLTAELFSSLADNIDED